MAPRDPPRSTGGIPWDSDAVEGLRIQRAPSSAAEKGGWGVVCPVGRPAMRSIVASGSGRSIISER